MKVIDSKIVCPACGKEMPVEVVVLKDSLMGNRFKKKNLMCEFCYEMISLDEVYMNYFLQDFEDIICEEMEELEFFFNELENIENSLGETLAIGVKKKILLLKMLKVNREQNLEKFNMLLDLLNVDLINLYKQIKKNIKKFELKLSFSKEFYFPTNFINKKINNILYAEYLLDYLSLCIHFVIGELFEYYERFESDIKLEEEKSRFLQLIYSIEMITYEVLKHYDFIEFFEEADMLDLLIRLSIKICEVKVLDNGYIVGLELPDKKKYIEKYDNLLKPKQKEIFFQYMNSKLFKTYSGIDRFPLPKDKISVSELETRKNKIFETDLKKDAGLIRNCIIMDFCEQHNISLTKKDLLDLTEIK